MVEMRVLFDQSVIQNKKTVLIKKIFYLSEHIKDFSLIEADGFILGIDLILNAEVDKSKLEKHVNRIIREEVAQLKDIQNDVYWQNDDTCCGDSGSVLERLLFDQAAHIHGDGQVSINGLFVDLYDCLDSLFNSISVNKFSAKNYRFPTLLKTSVLRKAGYFDSFPNLLMFVNRLRHCPDNYDKFKTVACSCGCDEQNYNLTEYLCDTYYNLPPTMCYYVYDMFSEQQLSADICVTTRGKSFRYENKYHKPFQRLWDFTIRETVFLGSNSFVREGILSYKYLATKLMELLELKGYCQTATDPFFLTTDVSSRVNAQKLVKSKYELHIRLNPDETTAVGSFNLHGQFISKRFALYKDKPSNEFIYTGCVGIGLERLLFAFLSQHGLHKEKWPPIVIDLLKNKQSAFEFIHCELDRLFK